MQLLCFKANKNLLLQLQQKIMQAAYPTDGIEKTNKKIHVFV